MRTFRFCQPYPCAVPLAYRYDIYPCAATPVEASMRANYPIKMAPIYKVALIQLHPKVDFFLKNLTPQLYSNPHIANCDLTAYAA